MIPTLRPYQLEAIAAVAQHMRDGHKNVLLVSPTGSGKTVIAAEVIRRLRQKGKRALFLAHARQLIYQASEKLSAIDVGHGIIMAGERPAPSDVQVASLHTLRHRPLPPADLVVVDEADLARASTYGEVLQHYASAFVLGMTASPWRGDGKGLGELFNQSVLVATPKRLIADGFLVPYEGFAFEPLDVSGIKTNRDTGDYNEKELARRAVSEAGRKIVGNVVEEYRRRAAGRRAVCFAVSVEHSKLLVERFVAAGIAAEHVDAEVPKTERSAMFARVRSGQTLVISTVGILTRGVDIPALEVAILARATKSLSLFLQMVGRVMRPSTDTGKAKALILDHAGCIMRGGKIVHGLPDDDRDYSLTSDLRKAAERDDSERPPSIVQCRACYAICPSGQETCHVCGTSLLRPREPETLDFAGPARAIPLEEVRTLAVERDPGAEQAYLNGETMKAQRFGWKPNAPSVRFKHKFGRWPTRKQLALAIEAAAVQAERGAA